MQNDIHEGEVLDSMPRQESTAITVAENPYLPMAMRAMELGKVEQLDKLLELQLKWDAEQARRAFVAAMAEFKAQPIQIIKDKLVEFTTRDGDITSYRHATLAGVVDAVVSAMGRHGLSHRWDVKQEGGQVSVTCTITHRGGHSESVTMQAAPDASGKKNSIQQVASAVTYLQRYTLMAATGVASADMQEDDGRKAVGEPEYISDEQEVQLRDLLEAYVTDTPAFFGFLSSRFGYPIDKLTDLLSQDFERARSALNEVKRRAEKGNA